MSTEVKPALAPSSASDDKAITTGLGTVEVTSDLPADDQPPVAPDQFDPRYETTRKELWAYYA